MKPEADERSEREMIEHVYREVSDALAERPDPRVRAAVLAAAARAVGAKPHDAARLAGSHPFAARRWPLSAAALLVVSIMTGLVATHGWWERPDLVDANQARPEATQAPAQAPAQAPSQAVVPSTSDTQGAGAIGPADSGADKGRSANREPEPRSSSLRRRAPNIAAAGPNDSVARNAPSATAPDLAGEISSGPTRQKAEASASNAAPLPAAPATSTAITPRALSRSTEGQAEAREKPGASSRAELESPEAWSDHIVKLREAGNDEEADREVARLKQRYPNFAIPREALRAMGTR
ncbi:MAG: hypothetical protein ACR2GP_14385 [Burkholderiaceae bacterium]